MSSFIHMSLSHLQACVDAHVLKEVSLRHGSPAGHHVSCYSPQVAEVHVSCKVSSTRVSEDIVELVASKPLHGTITFQITPGFKS